MRTRIRTMRTRTKTIRMRLRTTRTRIRTTRTNIRITLDKNNSSESEGRGETHDPDSGVSHGTAAGRD